MRNFESPRMFPPIISESPPKNPATENASPKRKRLTEKLRQKIEGRLLLDNQLLPPLDPIKKTKEHKSHDVFDIPLPIPIAIISFALTVPGLNENFSRIEKAEKKVREKYLFENRSLFLEQKKKQPRLPAINSSSKNII